MCCTVIVSNNNSDVLFIIKELVNKSNRLFYYVLCVNDVIKETIRFINEFFYNK